MKLKVVLLFLFFIIINNIYAYKIQLTSGMFYSSGDYGGDSDVDITYIPFTGILSGEKYQLKLTIPYITLSSESDGYTFNGARLVSSRGKGGRKKSDTYINENIISENNDTSESGMGDIKTSFTYYLTNETTFLPMTDLIGKVKFGTADEKKMLGTGETDYSVELGLTKTFSSKVLYSNLGYNFYGNPEDYDFNNTFYYILGFNTPISTGLTAGIEHFFSQKITDDEESQSEVTIIINKRIANSKNLKFYCTKGFSDSSPDYSIGFTFGMAFSEDNKSMQQNKNHLSENRSYINNI